MKRPTEEHAQRYLLGQMPEAEREALEDQYFTEEGAFEELKAAEDDLIDAYSRGTLAPERRAAFEAQYLHTETGRQRIAFARALKSASVRFRERRSLDAVARPPTRWLAVAAGLAVAALAGGLLLSVLQLRGTLREASAEKEALRRTAAEQERQLRGQESRIATLATELERLRAATADLGTLLSVTDLKRVATVVLRAGLQREGGDVPRVVLEPGTELVRVTVPLKMDRYPSYAVSIQDVDGRELWSRDGLHSLPRVRVPVGTLSVYGPGLVLFVPASVLVPEHYVVAVRGQGQPASQLHAEFVLQVVRR